MGFNTPKISNFLKACYKKMLAEHYQLRSQTKSAIGLFLDEVPSEGLSKTER